MILAYKTRPGSAEGETILATEKTFVNKGAALQKVDLADNVWLSANKK